MTRHTLALLILPLAIACHRAPTPHKAGAIAIPGPANPVVPVDQNGNLMGGVYGASPPIAIPGPANPVNLVDQNGNLIVGFAPALDGGYPASVAAPGTPAYNPTWYAATDIYTDFAAGLDTNSGTAIGAPIATCAEYFRRYGSHYATLAPNQATHWHILTGQTLAQGKTDPCGVIAFTAPGNSAYIVQGTLAAVGGTFLAGTVTPISRGNPGNDITIDLTAGAANNPAAGMLLFDSTVTNGSYCVIDSMAGNVATCTSPHLGTALTTPSTVYTTTQNGASWTSGTDTLQLYTRPTIYAESWEPTADLVSNVSTNGYSWLQGVDFGELYNATGVSLFTIKTKGRAIINLVSSNDFTIVDGSSAAGLSFQYPIFGSPWWNGGVKIGGSGWVIGGAWNTSAGGNTSTISDQPILQHDVIVHGTTVLYSYVQARNVHVPTGASFQPSSPSGVVMISPTAAGAIWGAGTIQVNQGGNLINRTGSTWATELLVNSMTRLEGITAMTTGYTPPISGTFTNNGVTQVDTAAAFPITSAVSWSLATVGGTPCLAGGPYFSAANTLGNFFTKAVTPSCNDVYNYTAGPGIVTITSANVDLYESLCDVHGIGCYTN